MSLRKIISGGQIGVDQAALQAAIDSGFENGGWCPPGRICDSGKIPEDFNLTETPVDRDKTAIEIPRSQRTIWNVRDSGGLLVFGEEEVTKLQSDKGTKLALETAKNLGMPLLVLDISKKLGPIEISNWISSNKIEVLNVAGPSENSITGIYDRVYVLMRGILVALDDV